jgi:hypothetical protein
MQGNTVLLIELDRQQAVSSKTCLYRTSNCLANWRLYDDLW